MTKKNQTRSIAFRPFKFSSQYYPHWRSHQPLDSPKFSTEAKATAMPPRRFIQHPTSSAAGPTDSQSQLHLGSSTTRDALISPETIRSMNAQFDQYSDPEHDSDYTPPGNGEEFEDDDSSNDLDLSDSASANEDHLLFGILRPRATDFSSNGSANADSLVVGVLASVHPALADDQIPASEWLRLGVPNLMMVDAVTALAKNKALESAEMASALHAAGMQLLKERARKFDIDEITHRIGRFRGRVRGLCVGAGGALGVFVPISPSYSHWDIAFSDLPTTRDLADLPSPLDLSWAAASRAFFDREAGLAAGKAPGHILQRRALSTHEEFMKRPASTKKGPLEAADARAQSVLDLFGVAPCLQRANQRAAGEANQLDLTRGALQTARLCDEVLEVAEGVLASGGDISGDLTAGNFSGTAAALRHARTSPGLVSPLCIQSGSEAALAAVGIALAAIDLTEPGMWPWANLPDAEKAEALQVASELDENGRAAKLQKISTRQMQFLVMKLTEGGAPAGRA